MFITITIIIINYIILYCTKCMFYNVSYCNYCKYSAYIYTQFLKWAPHSVHRHTADHLANVSIDPQ